MYYRIKELCQKHGISAREVEKELSLGTRSLDNWDSHSPSINSVLAVANYFGVSVDYLIGRDGPDVLSPDETKLILLFRQLNDDGKLMVLEYVEYISSKDKYKKCNFASELEA